MVRTEFKLYKVDMKYIRNLHNIDDKVFSVSPQTGKDNRVFVGIVVICGVHKYCIPLSSPKKKHSKMRNTMDFSKIEVNGKLLGVLNFNQMIPIEEAQLQVVNTTVYKRDRQNIKYYKQLCEQELEWCQNNSEVICNKANVLYRKYLSNEDFSGRERCLNFPSLEAECKKYNEKITLCDECGSEFFKASSKIKKLCPECAHILYGYPKCNHVFENGKCVYCYWDGRQSKYIKSLNKDT